MDVFHRAERPEGVTPTLKREGANLIFDGGYTNGPNLCTDKVSEKDKAPYALVIRTPMNADLQLKGSLRVRIGDAPSGEISFGDCVEGSIEDISSALNLTLVDQARIDVGSIDSELTLVMKDEAKLSTAAVIGSVHMETTDSAKVLFETVLGDLRGHLNDSAYLKVDLMLGDTIPFVTTSARIQMTYPQPAE